MLNKIKKLPPLIPDARVDQEEFKTSEEKIVKPITDSAVPRRECTVPEFVSKKRGNLLSHCAA